MGVTGKAIALIPPTVLATSEATKQSHNSIQELRDCGSVLHRRVNWVIISIFCDGAHSARSGAFRILNQVNEEK